MAHKALGKHYRKGITLVELFKMFPDNASAEKWFVETRWPDGIRCAYCDSQNVKDNASHKTMPYRVQHLQKAILGKDKFAVARGHKWVLYHLDKRTPTHLNNRNPIHNNNKPPSSLSTKMTISSKMLIQSSLLKAPAITIRSTSL